MSFHQEKKKHVAVCGGGLVGALNACYMARRGYKVDLYEMRPDIRTMKVVRGKSINLALSCRGREALKRVGLEDAVTKYGIPMHARMIHDLNGRRRPILYGTKDQYIMSIDRRLLNEIMLSAVEKFPDVEIHFSHKLTTCNFETGEATFENEQGHKVTKQFDLIIGCDGAYSAVRKQMMKLSRFDYQQTYIPHGYMELNIPPNSQNEFAMEINYLHIWPRNEYMMIALPNLDKSFTTTLFMPFEMFEAITTEEKLIQFFKEEFPDALPLLGQEELIKTFMSSKALPLITVKCHPYHVNNKAVLLGDAAHAMVPFYGQGMNCGMEDCIILDEILDAYDNDFSKALPAYTKKRNPDAKAICDLAMYNYIEMRSKVNTTSFLIRKKLDNLLFKIFPKTWVPLYTMVSFTRIGYQEAIKRREWQDQVLTRCLTVLGITGVVGLGVMTYQLSQNYVHWSERVQNILSQFGMVY
uniref:Kynurenine 3-monooxygenase n=1 Tax=Biomphalaria glabrata TaxID=6526 RepID=A0A2C9JJ57_BIOGL